MALQAAFLFLIGDADETTRTVVSTPSIHLNVVGCKTYAEAEAAAKELAAGGVTEPGERRTALLRSGAVQHIVQPARHARGLLQIPE